MSKDEVKKYAGDITPEEAWNILQTESTALLIDCRTEAEWVYVGKTDLSRLDKEQLNISWKIFPTMDVNPTFTEELTAACPQTEAKLLMMCRSGVRSVDAAIAATSAGYNQAYNILEGFEGDMNTDGHRGTIGGWKHCGLPWKQR